MRNGFDYPAVYEKTLAEARKQTEFMKTIETIDEIENRWARVTASEDYSFRDIKKETLLSDIARLIECCIVFINKIEGQEALMRHRAPDKHERKSKKIALPKE